MISRSTQETTIPSGRHDRKYRANLQVWKVTDLLDFLERPRKLEKTQTDAM